MPNLSNQLVGEAVSESLLLGTTEVAQGKNRDYGRPMRMLFSDRFRAVFGVRP